MKMISANKLNRLWKNGVVAKMVAKTKVLKTMEEISANTSEENVAGATAVKELSNNLSKQPEWIRDSTGRITGYKFGGADAVFPFSNVNYVLATIDDGSGATMSVIDVSSGESTSVLHSDVNSVSKAVVFSDKFKLCHPGTWEWNIIFLTKMYSIMDGRTYEPGETMAWSHNSFVQILLR